jgi:hypothetical protein
LILLSILLFEFTTLAGNIISTQPLPSPSPSPVPLVSPGPAPAPVSALENRRNLLIVRLKPQIDAYKHHHALMLRLFPDKDKVPSQGQVKASVDPITAITATNAALGAIKEGQGLVRSFISWCSDCVNDIHTRHAREIRRAADINKLCIDM